MEATCGSEAAKISKNKGKMVETSGSQPSQESEIPNQRGPGVVFILDNLLFQAEDDFRGPLQFILESPLNRAGMVQAVYVNFGLRGCFEIKPHADIVPSPNAFENLLRCLSGTSPQDGINLQNYITAATNDQTFVFVVGEFTNKEIEAYIDDYVKVSEYELNAVACIADVCLKLERKCNMF